MADPYYTVCCAVLDKAVAAFPEHRAALDASRARLSTCSGDFIMGCMTMSDIIRATRLDPDE